MSKTIWVDLDNTPHVLFFNPIIPELEKKGYRVLVTARDAYQVTDVADLFKLQCIRIGKHYGKNKLMKVIGTFIRALELVPIVLRNRPALAVSHGSRSQHVAANILRIKSLDIYDYEHCATFFFTKTTWAIAPEVVVRESGHKKARKETFGYPGIKEDAYIPFFTPDTDIRKELGLSEKEVVVLVRPPATEAHYHNPEAEAIFDRLIKFIDEKNAKGILIPRNNRQAEELRNNYKTIFEKGTCLIPEKVYNGLLLIWFADLVVSGGGTMNREAAALGVPVYSIFRGKMGAVDRYLSREGKLILIEKPEDVETKIRISKREISPGKQPDQNQTLESIVSKIEELAGS